MKNMKLLLFAPVLLIIANMGVFAADQGKGENIVGEWNFDEGKGTNAVDSSGNGYDGTIIGAQYVKTKSGYCLKFNGKDNYLKYDFQLKHPLTNGTFEAWAYPDLDGYWLTKELTGVRRGEVTDAGNILIHLINDSWGAMIHDGENIFRIQGPKANDKQWTHLAITWSSTDNIAHFYVNGQEIEGEVPVWYAYPLALLGGSDCNFFVGSQSPRWPKPFNGLIDDVRLYDRNLTADEIQKHYQDGSNGR